MSLQYSTSLRELTKSHCTLPTVHSSLAFLIRAVCLATCQEQQSSDHECFRAERRFSFRKSVNLSFSPFSPSPLCFFFEYFQVRQFFPRFPFCLPGPSNNTRNLLVKEQLPIPQTRQNTSLNFLNFFRKITESNDSKTIIKTKEHKRER